MEKLAAFIPIALSIIAAGISAWTTLKKFRTRVDLSRAIQKNEQDVTELKKQLKANNLDAATAVVLKYARTLSPAERDEAETALTQPSASGRASYIRGVVAQ